MCIKRFAGNCPRYSFITYNGQEFYIDITDEMAIDERVMLVALDGSGAEDVDFNTEVESHYISPLEARKIGKSLCAKGLFDAKRHRNFLHSD